MSLIKPNRECVPLDRLIREPGMQMRAGLADGLTDLATVERYREALVEGDEFPPLDVVSDGSSYWLFDGFQRAAAIERAGRDSAECLVYPGSHLDAMFRALGANARHGLTRTLQDCRRALTTVIENPELLQTVLARAGTSGGASRALATTCGVSKGLVAKVFEELNLRVVGGRLVKRRPVTETESAVGEIPSDLQGEGDVAAVRERKPTPGECSRSPRADSDLASSNPLPPAVVAAKELERARRLLALLWNSCCALLDGPYAPHLLRCATRHRIPFSGERSREPSSDSASWNPIRHIDAVLSDLAAATWGGMEDCGE